VIYFLQNAQKPSLQEKHDRRNRKLSSQNACFLPLKRRFLQFFVYKTDKIEEKLQKNLVYKEIFAIFAEQFRQ